MHLKMAANVLIGVATFALCCTPALAITRWIPLPVAKSVAIDTSQPGPNISRGAVVYKNCRACHDIGQDAGTRVGPDLTGIVGRPAAVLEDYTYSKAMHEAGKEGLIWSRDLLDQYLSAPTKFIPGNKMAYIGLNDAEARRNLIAYLATFEIIGRAPWEPVEITAPLPDQRP
ncbi:Cytochrome c2 (modular protein) [Candidatus Filomicrobium marinum]|uniref:Cytochrome c2 (Modular protein) n=2 Tax=Filomicrobium TaxID=119044 RepID=A0A0D6JAJ5_9HYPH|nr:MULTISPECIES: cytochrome c family protein [Filomicrobium]MCV0368740.1 cytochrome c family protein [Filomicrobium sp.]CFW99267.1 Cytochrome c2 (modular protein) [Candidatus Filomicrobium marinum]CPR15027.1 Cytochrome c2 (modular protein) [Candidatus Filomicrobium marinum]SDO71672.1 cytochrome c [Filomicrobium insigne]